MSAKQVDPMVNVNFRIPVALNNLIDEAANSADCDKSEIVRRALKIGVEQMALVGFDIESVYRKIVSDAAAAKHAENMRMFAKFDEPEEPIPAKSKPLKSVETPQARNKTRAR